MDRQRTLLFVGAHPDDESFGLGATLAQYAAAGAKVYYACGTRGEVGVADPEFMKGFATIGDMRWAELKCAAEALGLTDVINLGYRDSGMSGSADNKHPDAMVNAPLEELTSRIVKVIRELKPQVVITFDPVGGYRHPDHIAIHNAAVKAFHAAGNAAQYTSVGAPYAPQKLYFGVFSHRVLKFVVRVLPLFGQNPRRFGRNKDIDLASIAAVKFPVHAALRLSKQAIRARDKAADCHASQMAGGPRRAGLFGLLNRLSTLFGERDLFMRAYPPVNGRRREKDLFEGVV